MTARFAMTAPFPAAARFRSAAADTDRATRGSTRWRRRAAFRVKWSSHRFHQAGPARIDGNADRACTPGRDDRATSVAADSRTHRAQAALPHGRDVRIVGRDRFAEGDRDRIRNALRPFEKITPAFERKDRTPQLIQPDRHDGTFGGARDQFVAALQPKQHAGARQFTLRKDADDFARFDPFRRRPHRVLGCVGEIGIACTARKSGLRAATCRSHQKR